MSGRNPDSAQPPPLAMAPAWTHLGYAVPDGVFGQEALALFEVEDLGVEPAAEWLPNGQ